LRNAPSDLPRRGDRLALALRALGAPRRYLRPWYLAYLLLGMVTAGLLPVLLPLIIEARSHSLATVAYVIGAYNFGLLTSPLWGMAAERGKAYRGLFLGSFLLTGAGIAALLLVQTVTGWLVSAFAIGAGSGGAATLATLFVVDFAPQAEWEPRIGWLQSFNATGQVVGLMVAAVFSNGHFAAALWGSVALLVLATALGGVGLPAAANQHAEGAAQPHKLVHLHLDIRALAIFPKLSLPSDIGLHFYHLNLRGLRALPEIFGTPFGRFLLSWFVLAFAVAAFFSYFPLMLAHSYGISARSSALIYAATVTVGIALYVLASRLIARHGAARIYRLGLYLRVAGFAFLLAPFAPGVADRGALGGVGFSVIVIAWPLLSVAGTELGASLTPFSEGAAVGLLNAALALATALGIVCSGPLVARWGYAAIPATALAGLVLSVALGRSPRPPRAGAAGAPLT
jgi:MFS family permease